MLTHRIKNLVSEQYIYGEEVKFMYFIKHILNENVSVNSYITTLINVPRQAKHECINIIF